MLGFQSAEGRSSVLRHLFSKDYNFFFCIKLDLRRRATPGRCSLQSKHFQNCYLGENCPPPPDLHKAWRSNVSQSLGFLLVVAILAGTNLGFLKEEPSDLVLAVSSCESREWVGCMVRIKRTAAPLPDNPHICRLLGLLTVCLLWTEHLPWADSERNSRESLTSPFIVVTSQSYQTLANADLMLIP